MSVLSQVPLSEVPGPSAHAELLLAIKQHKSSSLHKQMNLVSENASQQTSNSEDIKMTPVTLNSLSRSNSSDSNEMSISISSGVSSVDEVPTSPVQQPPFENTELLCGICYDNAIFLPNPGETLGFHDGYRSPHRNNPCSNFNCCQDCMLTFLSNKIKEKNIGLNLKCPAGCGETLTPTDVRNIFLNSSSTQFNEAQSIEEEYNIVLKEVSAIEHAKNRRLNRTIPSASDVYNSVKFHLWSVGKDIQRCGGCHMMIEKNGGCSHMTCQHCRHEFYWCCGQSYSQNHNQFICTPIKYAYHRSKWWGPILPIRMLTKTTVLGVGVSLGVAAVTIAAVGYGPVLLGKKTYRESGLKGWRQRRRDAAREALQQRLRAERARQMEIVNQAEAIAKREDLQALNESLKTYQPTSFQESVSDHSGSEDTENSVQKVVEDGPISSGQTLRATTDTIEMMHMHQYQNIHDCVLCGVGRFYTPGDYFRHLRQCHLSRGTNACEESEENGSGSGGGGSGGGEEINEIPSIINSFIEKNLHKPANLFKNYWSECNFLVEEQQQHHQSSSSEGTVVLTDQGIIQKELSAVTELSIDQQLRSDDPASSFTISQHCSCGVEFDNIQSWCTHLANHNKKSVLKTIAQPAACEVLIRPGYLCPCTGCNDVNATHHGGRICVECNHPRMLHNDRIRRKRSSSSNFSN